MTLHTLATFLLALFPGAALGIILLCAHVRLHRGIERNRLKVHLSQLPFVLGPLLLTAAAAYSIFVGDFHPPEIALAAGIVVGMCAIYGSLYLHLSLDKRAGNCK